jgi:hypothetical protein
VSCSPRLFVAISLVALTAVACSGGGGGARTLAVTSTDTACDLSRSTVDPGKVEVTVTNKGQDVTEVYVYATNDRPLGEVEHIQPGDKGTFTADVGGGDYQVACKPGEKGDGIRSALHVTGPAASTASEDAASRDRATYRGQDAFGAEVDAYDDRLELDKTLAVVQGQSVTFSLHNHSATTAHGFRVFGPDGAMVGEIPSTPPNGRGTVALSFTVLGSYRYADPLGDAANTAFQGSFDVIE